VSRCAALAALLLLSAGPARGDDTSKTIRVLPEWHSSRGDSPFAGALPQLALGRDRSTEELEMRTAVGRLDLIATARSSAQQGARPDNEFVLNQAAMDVDAGGGRLGFGKKIFSWDVGFGFRPLDLIEREDRRALLPGTLTGVPYLAWQSFGADSSWLFLYANPGRGKTVDPFDDESLSLKTYHRFSNIDLHSVTRLSRRFGLEAGAATSAVVGDSLELHASLLYQRRYEREVNRLLGSVQVLSATDPTRVDSENNGAKALLGFTWSTPQGTSIIGEAWYDRSAYGVGDWQSLADLARRQEALRGAVAEEVIDGNLAYDARAFVQGNLLRNNLLLHASHRAEGSDWEPAVDLLTTPADGGWVTTASIAYTGNQYRIDAGLRFYGGPDSAAYRLLPERRIGYLEWRQAF
jgi:hypothetical protein